MHRTRILLEGNIDSRECWLAQELSMVFRVFANADHGKWLSFVFGIVDLELSSERVLAVKEMFYHGLVHHGYPRRAGSVLTANAAAHQDGNAHNVEVPSAHAVL